jgi:hypothetical protein
MAAHPTPGDRDNLSRFHANGGSVQCTPSLLRFVQGGAFGSARAVYRPSPGRSQGYPSR